MTIVQYLIVGYYVANFLLLPSYVRKGSLEVTPGAAVLSMIIWSSLIWWVALQ